MRAACLLVVLSASSAVAYEQPLSFTVTGPTVEPGAHELVVSTTPRFGRPREFIRLESLLGFGYGFTSTVEAQLLIAVSVEAIGREGRSAEGGGQTRLRWQPLDSHTDFLGLNVLAAVGISPDSVKSHVKFRTKYDLPFTLLADTEQKVATRYDVWKEKSMYGRKYMGVMRTTFIIDARGTLRKIFTNVKSAGHAAEVMAAIAAL